MVARGSAPLWELRERYALPLEESVHYHTMAGLLLARLGHIPQGGEAIVEQGYTPHCRSIWMAHALHG